MMQYTDDERRVLDALAHKRGVVSKAHISAVAQALGVKPSSFEIAWSGLIEKGKLRAICEETAELIRN